MPKKALLVAIVVAVLLVAAAVSSWGDRDGVSGWLASLHGTSRR